MDATPEPVDARAQPPADRPGSAQPSAAGSAQPPADRPGSAQPSAAGAAQPPAIEPPELNQTGRVVLGMLAEGHTTGYAIKSEIERSTRLFWGASVGGIYPELRRLAAAGLVTVRDDPRGETRRHCYSLTEAGRAALRAWLDDDASEPTLELRHEQLLRLRFAGVLDPAERRALVARMRELHTARVQELHRRLERERFDDAFDRLTARYALDFNEWAAGWAAEIEADLARAATSSSDSGG